MGGNMKFDGGAAVRTLVVTGLMLVPVLIGGAASAQTTILEPVQYGATGWSYKQVAWGADAGFEAPAYDDSTWNVGQGGFGSNNGCPLVPNTHWSLNTDMLLRRTFTIDRPFSGLQVGVAIDNNVQVWLNGVDISGGMRASGGCAVLDRFVFTVPDGVGVVGENVLAIRGHDYGGVSYVDARVQFTEEGPPVPVPELGSLVLLSMGLLVLAGVAVKRRRA